MTTTIVVNAKHAEAILVRLIQELGLMVSMATIAIDDVQKRSIAVETMDHMADHLARVIGTMSVTAAVLQLPHPLVEMTERVVQSLQPLVGNPTETPPNQAAPKSH